MKICDEIDGMKREQHIWDGPEEAAISRKLRARNVRLQAAAIAPRDAEPSRCECFAARFSVQPCVD